LYNKKESSGFFMSGKHIVNKNTFFLENVLLNSRKKFQD